MVVLNLPMKNVSSISTDDYVSYYRTQGYSVIRGVFDPKDICELSIAFDRLKQYAQQFDTTFRHKNQLYVFQQDGRGDKLLRFVRWPSYTFAEFEKYRIDLRLLKVIEPLLGNNIKQITNQTIWKSPEDARTSYSFHQDAYWRKPESAYRNLAGSYLQTAIAIDPHTHTNGCLKLVPGSHLLGSCYTHSGSVLTKPFSSDLLKEYGMGASQVVDIIMEPGDVAIWHPYMFHGSEANLSDQDRRSYINGFVTADKCDRGEYAFRNGQPVALGEPQLVDYDELYSKPEPHYI